MTVYINDVPIPFIEEYNISTSSEIVEVDLLEDDINSLLYGNDEGQDIDISFSLLKEVHPEKLDVENQRDDVKELSSKEASENYINLDDLDGWISIENIDIPENSDQPTYTSGSISGKFLPNPKHFTSDDVGNTFRYVGFLKFQLEFLDNFLDSVETVENDGSLSYSSNIKATPKKVVSIRPPKRINGRFGRDFGRLFGGGGIQELNQGKALSYSYLQSGELSIQDSFVGVLAYELDFKFNLSGAFGRDFARSFGGGDILSEPVLNKRISGGFGRDFGRSFGGGVRYD